MSRSFPLALKLEGRKCLVVGSTPEAAQRATAFLESGAEVHVIARSPSAELVRALEGTAARLHEREYRALDLHGTWLAVLTDRDPELARRMAEDAEAARVFFCAVDVPGHGSFSHMAVARAGIVTFAVASEGRAPALARRLREELQRVSDEAGLAEFAEELAVLRDRTPSEARREVLGDAVAAVRLEGRLELRAK